MSADGLTGTHNPTDRRATDDHLPLVRGAVYGAITWICGVLAVVLFAMGLGGNGDIYVGAMLTWHSLNLVPLAIGLTGLTAVVAPLSAIPVLALVFAGHRTAARFRRGGILAGATVALGYLPLTALSYFVGTVFLLGAGPRTAVTFGVLSAPGGVLTELAFVGVAMPALFGGTGGWLASR